MFSADWLEPLAQVLGRLGAERAWVVHGEPGLDELSTVGTTHVAEWDGSTVRRFTIEPEDAGLERATLADLKGGDAEENAAAIHAMLAGIKGPLRDAVLLAAAATLVVAGKADDLRDGVAQAGESIDSGRARAALDRLAAITHEAAA